MANSHTAIFARQTIRMSPWFLCGTLVLCLATCFYGVAPLAYLLACAGLGIVWLFILAFAWRRRNEALRFFSTIFVILGQQILWHRIGHGQTFEIMQGGFLLCAVASSLLLLLRRWLYKFSRLDDDAS